MTPLLSPPPQIIERLVAPPVSAVDIMKARWRDDEKSMTVSVHVVHPFPLSLFRDPLPPLFSLM